MSNEIAFRFMLVIGGGFGGLVMVAFAWHSMRNSKTRQAGVWLFVALLSVWGSVAYAVLR